MKKGGKSSYVRVKNISKNVWDEFVYGSHLVALGDIIALYVMSMMLKINVTVSFFIVVYLSILAVNLFNRYKDENQDELTNSERSDSVKKYFKFMPFVMAALFFVSVGITVYSASTSALIFMLFLFSIGIFYSLYLKAVTKKIIGFKNLMTALPYGLLVLFMSIYYRVPISWATVLVAIFYFLRLFINTTYFDIKDIKSDKSDGLKTLPVVFGEKKTKSILIYLNIFSVVPIFLGIYWKVLPFYSIALTATALYSFLYLGKRGLFNKQTILYNVVVDGEFIFWLPYILIGKTLL